MSAFDRQATLVYANNTWSVCVVDQILTLFSEAIILSAMEFRFGSPLSLPACSRYLLAGFPSFITEPPRLGSSLMDSTLGASHSVLTSAGKLLSHYSGISRPRSLATVSRAGNNST